MIVITEEAIVNGVQCVRSTELETIEEYIAYCEYHKED